MSMDLKEINKQIKTFNQRRNLSESDYRKLGSLLEKRAKESSRLTGLDIVSFSYEDAKAFREKIKRGK